MKVIFLDIDGPLITLRTIVANGGIPKSTDGVERRFFDETALKLLSGICRTSKAKIIISSTWRNSPCFDRMANNLGLPIIGRLSNTPDPVPPRGEEIRQWLLNHPEVTHYAIIDDDSDMLPEQEPYFVKVEDFNGITWEAAVKLADILGISIWSVNYPTNSKT